MTAVPADFVAFAAAAPDARFSDWLRLRAGDLWPAMIHHRFTSDIGADALPAAAFARYLRNEHAFVRTAVQIFGHALIKAPGAEDQRHLAAILNGLTNEQEDYFRETYARLDMDNAVADADVLPDAALALGEGALAIAANGAYEEILSAMLAAEWMYLEWCRREHARGPTEPEPARWIALHTGGEFAAGVAWTRGRVDALCPALDPQRQANCARNFRRMLRLEIAFHDAAYGDA